MPTIAIDIDDTLYDFGGLAREKWGEYAMERGDKSLQRGAYCAWPEWRSPADVVDLEHWLRIIDLCHAPDVIIEQIPYPGAYEGLWRLDDAGYDLLYISTRDPEVTEATRHWLMFQGFPYGDLICTHEDKIQYVRDCQYIVDDRVKTLVNFVYDHEWYNSGRPQRKGFALLKEYNRALTDVPNVYLAPTWNLLINYMEDKGVFDREGARN